VQYFGFAAHYFGRVVRPLDALRSPGDALCERWARCADWGMLRAEFGRAAQCGERAVRTLDTLRSVRDAPCERGTRCAVQWTH